LLLKTWQMFAKSCVKSLVSAIWKIALHLDYIDCVNVKSTQSIYSKTSPKSSLPERWTLANGMLGNFEIASLATARKKPRKDGLREASVQTIFWSPFTRELSVGQRVLSNLEDCPTFRLY
jgi:hypothetical protein